MPEPLYELPDSIELSREEYRQQQAALEAALDRLDLVPEADRDGRFRGSIESAVFTLTRRIWPYLQELDDEG